MFACVAKDFVCWTLYCTLYFIWPPLRVRSFCRGTVPPVFMFTIMGCLETLNEPYCVALGPSMFCETVELASAAFDPVLFLATGFRVTVAKFSRN